MAAWLEKHHPIAATDLIATAGGSGPAKVTIELVDNPDDLEGRQKKEEEAALKRQQNALPSWIEKSTITGELTAAGAAQATGTIIVEGDIKAEANNGVPSPKKTSNTADHDVDSYYAALAAAQSAYASLSKPATVIHEGSVEGGTPTQHGSPSSGLPANSKLVDSGYEEFGEDAFSVVSPASQPSRNAISPESVILQQSESSKNVDNPLKPLLRPPSVTSISNSLGKRSREPSEESEDAKKAKTKNTRTLSHEELLICAPLLDEDDEVDAMPEDPILTGKMRILEMYQKWVEADLHCTLVAGIEMPFSKITEEMGADMTPEEYSLWWETMAAVG